MSLGGIFIISRWILRQTGGVSGRLRCARLPGVDEILRKGLFFFLKRSSVQGSPESDPPTLLPHRVVTPRKLHAHTLRSSLVILSFISLQPLKMLSTLRIAGRQAVARRAVVPSSVLAARAASTWANVAQGPPVRCSLHDASLNSGTLC